MKEFKNALLRLLLVAAVVVSYGRFGYVLDTVIPQTNQDEVEIKVNVDDHYSVITNGTQKDIDNDFIIYNQGNYFHHNTDEFVSLIDSVKIGEYIKINGIVYELINKFPARTEVNSYSQSLGFDTGNFLDLDGNVIQKFEPFNKTRIFIITCVSNNPEYNRYFYEIQRH